MQNSPIDIRVIEGENAEDFGVIRQALTEFNKKVLNVQRQLGYVFAYDKEQVIGGISYRYYGPDAFLDYVCVVEEWRGSGVGQRLIAETERQLERLGCRRILVDTNLFQAPDFYRQLGYEQIAVTPDHLGGFDRVTFRKILTAAEDIRESA